MGKRNIIIDLVEPFGYTGDGEFFKAVPQNLSTGKVPEKSTVDNAPTAMAFLGFLCAGEAQVIVIK